MNLRCIQHANATLGEGPVWDGRLGALYWVDIRRMQVFRHVLATGQQDGQWKFAAPVGFAALTSDPGKLVVGAGMTILLVDLATGTETEIALLAGPDDRFRVNDAAVDAAGRLWIGTMIDDIHAPDHFAGGQLWRLSGPEARLMVDDLELPNGIGWSPDRRVMYLNDSTAYLTYAFDFDLASGSISGRRVLHRHDPAFGLPDGLAVDAQGNIWNGMWNGWIVKELAPDGAERARHPMPVERPSSVSFGGAELDTLLVTSATNGFEMANFIKSPLAGGLFAGTPGARGQETGHFDLSALGL